MSKKLILFFILIVAIFSYLFNVDRYIRSTLSSLDKYISKVYLNTIISSQTIINKYFSQLSYIEQLRSQNDASQKYKLLYGIKVNELDELSKIVKQDYNTTLELEKVKILSYYNLTEHSKVLIDKSASLRNKIAALITFDGFSAGIVLEKDGQTVAFLNNDKKCNYAVFIGDEYAPGITSGMSVSGEMIIDHVPLWKNVNIGDKVITSGMDNIFPYGIDVADVVAIHNGENTKKVLAKPFGNITGTRDFYLYDKNSSN